MREEAHSQQRVDDSGQPLMKMLLTGPGWPGCLSGWGRSLAQWGCSKAVLPRLLHPVIPKPHLGKIPFRTEKGIKISVGTEHPFVIQQGVHNVGSWDFQRKDIF